MARPHGDDAAVQREARAAHRGRRVRHDDARHRREEQARAHRLHEAAGEQHREVLREQRARAAEAASAPAPTKNTRLSPRRLSMNADSMMAVAATTMYPTITQFAMESVTPKRSASSGRATFIMLWPNEAVNEHASSTGKHARHASASLLRVAHPTALPRPFPRCARRGAATDASSVAAGKAGPGSVPNTQRSGHTAEGLPFNHH